MAKSLKVLWFFGFLVLGLITTSYAEQKINLPAGREYDLGNLEEGELYQRDFTIANSGDKPLEVKVVRVGCGCTTILYPKKRLEIAPGESIEAKFSYNTEGMEGEEIKYIYIESNDPNTPLLKLKLIAQVQRKQSAAIKRFLSWGLLTVVGAGLIDGINPCAFTVLVFFISFLNFVGYRKRELLVLGMVFIFAVFLTYILLGLGLFKFIQSLEAFTWFSKIIYLGTASLAIILGIYSLYDCYIYRKTGNPEDVKLRLPDFIKQKIHKTIQSASRNKKKALTELAGAVFLSGFIVSLLESVCTGQTYIPTIAYVFKEPGLRIHALGYLVLYNLMFILPLVIILIAGLAGVGSEVFSRLARKHLGTVKLLTAVLFFLLGILLFIAKG
ncbi:MAG: DUF1573 domain-containing protein [Candidatus Omnitrophota bacterium]|nr:DUF1573 domain-containing protein [Candidatus Omnitrophota bacterium]